MYETVDSPAHRWAYLRATSPKSPACGIPAPTAAFGLAALVLLAGLTYGGIQLVAPPPVAEAAP